MQNQNIINFERRIRMQNTGELVVFLHVLAADVKGAFLKESEAACLWSPPPVVVIKILQGCRYGCEG